MKAVLTLVGNPDSGGVQEGDLDVVRSIIPDCGEPSWLATDIACDLPIPSDNSALLTARVGKELATRRIDAVSQPADVAARRKKLLIADMDSTIIQQECIDEIAAYAGIGEMIAKITARAMAGEIEFEPALRERVALLRDVPLSALEEIYETRISEMPGGRILTSTMRANGGTCALVSGGFTFFTERVADRVGFDFTQANQLEHEAGHLTGTVVEPVLGRAAKLAALNAFAEDVGVSPEMTMAVGDGANDLDMIMAAGLGVAFHAKPIVAEAAPARLDHSDLTALLYIQGYRSDEFVTP